MPRKKTEKKSKSVVMEVEEKVGPPAVPERKAPVPARAEPKKEKLYIGIDIGSYISKVSASNGVRTKMYSIMGWPKDPISRKFIGKDVVFGEEVLKKKLALNIYHPIKTLYEDPKNIDTDALVDFFLEIANIAGGLEDKELIVLLTTHANIGKDSQAALDEAAAQVFDEIGYIPTPFAEAVALEQMHALVVNIGASAINMARVYGSIPSEEDYLYIPGGSSDIDKRILEAIVDAHPDAQITEDMVRAWKESSAFIGRTNEKIKVTVPLNGVPTEIDITDILGEACESIVEPIADGIRQLISTFDPEFQQVIRENVYLTGGGSAIKGLPAAIEETLSDMKVKVRAIKDPMYLAADGALRILQEVPELIEEL